jgi:hypothetical protein
MKDDEPRPEGNTPSDVASYIAELCGDLSGLARRQGLDVLAYMLDMAKLEAQNSMRFESE